MCRDNVQPPMCNKCDLEFGTHVVVLVVRETFLQWVIVQARESTSCQTRCLYGTRSSQVIAVYVCWDAFASSANRYIYIYADCMLSRWGQLLAGSSISEHCVSLLSSGGEVLLGGKSSILA